MPSILIAENHSVVRMGVSIIIKSVYPDAKIVETETFEEAVLRLKEERFDLLLLDIPDPGGDYLEIVELVRRQQPDVRILIFSSYDERLYAIQYLKAGVNGYLRKAASPEVIRQAITTVMNGEKYMSLATQKQLLEEFLNPKRAANESSPLSNREMEVMQMMVRGANAREIKQALNIQSSTLSTYKARIFEKMGVSNLIELAEKARALS